jgi:hypothetical protein
MEQSEERHEEHEETADGEERRDDERELDPAEAKAKEIEDDPSANPQDDQMRDIKGG